MDSAWKTLVIEQGLICRTVIILLLNSQMQPETQICSPIHFVLHVKQSTPFAWTTLTLEKAFWFSIFLHVVPLLLVPVLKCRSSPNAAMWLPASAIHSMWWCVCMQCTCECVWTVYVSKVPIQMNTSQCLGGEILTLWSNISYALFNSTMSC